LFSIRIKHVLTTQHSRKIFKSNYSAYEQSSGLPKGVQSTGPLAPTPQLHREPKMPGRLPERLACHRYSGKVKRSLCRHRLGYCASPGLSDCACIWPPGSLISRISSRDTSRHAMFKGFLMHVRFCTRSNCRLTTNPTAVVVKHADRDEGGHR